MEQQVAGPISKDQVISEVVSAHPAAADVFLSYGLHCIGCHVNAYETIDQGARAHGMTPDEVDEMVAEANEYLREIEQPHEGFTLTAKAVEKLKQLAAEEGKEGWGLRVEVAEGGCSGHRYNLEFEEKPKESDTVLDEGFRIFMDATSREQLEGGSLDYIDSLQGAGFKVHNPRAKSHCGCGKSFS